MPVDDLRELVDGGGRLLRRTAGVLGAGSHLLDGHRHLLHRLPGLSGRAAQLSGRLGQADGRSVHLTDHVTQIRGHFVEGHPEHVSVRGWLDSQ